MLKKLTLASVATLALLMIPAQAEGPKCQTTKCCDKSKSCKKSNSCKKMKKKGHNYGLLLHLPSPMRTIIKYEDDAKLGLSAEQKEKLAGMRAQMMPKMMKLQEDIQALSKEIKASCKAGAKLANMKEKVEKLATLKTHATMTKLGCIEKVKELLNDEQETFIKDLRKARMEKRKAMRKDMKKNMKCQAEKCVGNK